MGALAVQAGEGTGVPQEAAALPILDWDILLGTGSWLRATFALPKALASPGDAWIIHQIIYHPSSEEAVCLNWNIETSQDSLKIFLFSDQNSFLQVLSVYCIQYTRQMVIVFFRKIPRTKKKKIILSICCLFISLPSTYFLFLYFYSLNALYTCKNPSWNLNK